MFLISTNVAGGIGFSRDGSILGGRSEILDFTGKRLAYQPDPVACSSVSAIIDIEALRQARRQDNGTMNPAAACALGNVPPLLRRSEFLPAEQFPGTTDGGSERRGWRAGPIDREHAAPAGRLIAAGLLVPVTGVEPAEGKWFAAERYGYSHAMKATGLAQPADVPDLAVR